VKRFLLLICGRKKTREIESKGGRSMAAREWVRGSTFCPVPKDEMKKANGQKLR